mmetsp:Transcript_47424/g.143564  ORF Transcript_47424/g.143564 Transcript_47424/m.143564 type:complete len:197 (+) Transcript_47424:204-794(+)
MNLSLRRSGGSSRRRALASVLVFGSASGVAFSFSPSASHAPRPFAALSTRLPSAAAAGAASKHRCDASKLSAGGGDDEFFGSECILTPEGFGFASSGARVLESAGRGNGYHRAKGSDTILDVMEGISGGSADAALVFDDDTDDLIGLFTETDYIRVCIFVFSLTRICTSWLAAVDHSFQRSFLSLLLAQFSSWWHV